MMKILCGCQGSLLWRLWLFRGRLISSLEILTRRRNSQKSALKELPHQVGDDGPAIRRAVVEPPFVFYRPKAVLYRIQRKSGPVSAEAGGLNKHWKLGINDFKLLNAVDPRVFEWKKRDVKLKELYGIYTNLSKLRLTGLVTTTAMTGYALAPDPFLLSTFLLFSFGTSLLSACANTFNQFLEIPYDAQMKRTQSRALVRGLISPLNAAVFGTTCGALGFSALFWGVNSLTALLGIGNAVLYFGVYTPLKRFSIGCTWVGAVVGAIPPLMGWAACCNSLSAGALTLAAILYAWQFPHFNGLSWNLRPEYSRAGYRVMCVTSPGLCRTTTLRYSIVLFGLCSLAAPLTDLTTWMFAADSVPLNSYLVLLSWRFYRKPDSQTSRKLFRYSLIYLPAIMMLMLISKKGVKIAGSC